MKIAATIIGTDEKRFGHVAANNERIALAKRIATATRNKADLVLLPAGLLAAGNANELEDHARELAAIFPHCGLLAGVDLDRGQRDRAKGHAGKGHTTNIASKNTGKKYPFWGFASDGGKVREVWQQRSVMPEEPVEDKSGRIAKFGDTDVGVLLCGEVYNKDLRPALYELKPKFVVDLGHISMGQKFTYTLLNVANAVGCNVYHTQHVAWGSRAASKWMSTLKQASFKTDYDWASYTDDNRVVALWAEVKMWDT